MAPLTLSNYLGTLQDDPDNGEAFDGLKEVLVGSDTDRLGGDPVRLIEAARVGHERRGELRAAAWLIELEAGLVTADPDLEAALWKELGRLRHEELLDDSGAREAYQKALDLRPGDDEVQEAVEQIDQAARSWRQIADRFVEEAESASDATLRTSLLTRAAALVWQYKKRGAAKETDKLFRKALESDPGETRTARLYAETLRSRDRWSDVAEVLVEAARHGRNRDDRLNLYVQAGRAFRHRLEQPERAAECYEQVLDFAPGHQEALGYLVEYFTEREEWEHLVALYEDALRSRQKLDSEQGILLQLGMVHWRIRRSADEAEPYFARLRKLDPAHPGMLDFYREHLASGEDPQRLVTILSDAQRVATDEQLKRELAVELARAAQKSEATVERAIEAWKSVQRLEPSHPEARAALKDLYRRTEKWNALVEILKAEVGELPDDARERRSELLRELVPIYRDRLQLDAMVINTYNSILQDAPDDREALAELARTYEQMGRWNDLIQVLTRQAEASDDEAAKVRLYMRVASLWIERFANYNQATRPLEHVIELDPDNREALSQLKDIYTKKRAWKPLFEVLRKEADLASDPEARIQGKVEIAQLAGERLHRHADAIALWREVVREAPDTAGALEALEKLAEREKDWASLAEALEIRLGRTEAPEARVRVLQRLGGVLGDHLDDHARAADAWKRVLDIDPQNGRALRTLRESFLAARDWAGLEAMYADASDWEGLVEVLGGAAERTDDPELKKDLSFRAAEVYEEKIGEPHRAFRNYERVLAVDPNNVRAARALIPIYEREEKWPRLVGLLETLLGDAADDAQSLELLARLRDLCSDQLRDQRRAFEYAARAYRLAPEDRDVIAALELAADASGAYDELRRAYDERLAQARGREQAELRRRIASIAGDKLGRSDEAIGQLEAVLEASPTDPEVQASLERLYRAEDRVRDLRNLYATRLEHADDPEQRRNLLVELARLEEDRLGDSDAAAQHYRALLEIDSADREALAALDRLATASERWQELADVLRQRCELAAGDDERVELMRRLAALYLEPLHDAPSALDAYGEIVRMSAGDEGVITGLERIEASVPELAIDAGRLLEGIYESRAHYEKLAAVLRRRLDASEDEEEKRELSLRLAELAGSELGDVEGAYTALEGAFLDRPEDEALWDRLATAAERAGKNEELAQAFATALEAGDLDDVQVAALAARVAELYDVVLGHPAQAEPFHKRILRGDPLSEGSFVALKELYTNEERWDDLQALYRNRIAETLDGEAKLELLLQVCFLFEEILDDPEHAIRSYQEVVELRPDHHASRRALERLYRRTQRWRELAVLLREDMDQAEGHEIIDALFELGELHETKLGEPSQAVDFYEQVLEQSPTHLRAQEALERLLPEPSQRQRIAAVLEPLYDAQGAWSELVRVLEVQLEDAGDPGSRVALLTRIAELHEHRLHNADKAFGALARALEADPGDGSVREELARLAAVRGAQRERAAVLERAIEESESSPHLQSEMLLELARLWDEQEGDGDAAERAYKRLLQLEPDNPDLVLPASRALERIHLSRTDYPALVEDLRRQIRFEDDPEVRSRLLVRVAELLEQEIGDGDAALEAHRQRLDLDPMDVDALHALERLYEQKGEWQKLIGVLQSQEQAADDEAERRRICARVGEIYETRLEDQDNAIVAYNDVVTRFGQDREALAALARLYERGQKWEDLLDTLEMQQEVAETAAERAELRFRAAELMRTRTADVERAIEAYDEVLAQSPEHPGAVTALERIIDDAEGVERIMAARVLAPRFEGVQAYDRLVRVLEVVAESDEPLERLQALRRAAEVADVGLEDPARAFGLMGRAVRAGVAEDDLPALISEHERLAAGSGNWAGYVSVLREVAPDILDGDLQIEVLMKVAAAARARLQDPALARQLYDRVLENRPDMLPALDALEELHAELEDHSALLEVLQRKTEIADDPNRRVDLLLRQAQLCEAQSDLPAAIDAYEQVLVEAERAEAFEGLERLYTQDERWNDLASLYERQLDAGVGVAVDVRYRLGRLQLDHLSDARMALEHFREVLAQRRDHEPSIAALERLMGDEELKSEAAAILEPVFLTRMDWSKVSTALEARLSDETDVETRKELLRRLGQLHEDYLEDLDGALETYARLFREDPGDQEALDVLSRLARNLERWDRLAEIYGQVLEQVTVDDDTTSRLAFMTGKLHGERTGDLDQAAVYYQRVLRFDPTDREAFGALESVLERQQAWEPLLDLYREQVDVSDADGDRIDLLHKSATLREERLRDAEGAIEAHRDVLTVDPAEAASLDALERLFIQGQRWTDLADHLRHRIDLVLGSPEETDLKHRLGRLLVEKLDDKVAGIDAFEEVVQVEPAHQATIQALEQLVLDEEHQLRITQILEPIYRGTDQWKKLVAILEAQVEMTDDPLDTARLLGEVGRLHEERGGDLARAFHAWCRAFVLEPHEETARHEVERIGAANQAWDELVGAYESAIAAADDPTIISELLGVMARVHDEKRGDPRAAIETYERLLAHEPDEASPLDALEALHTMVGDWRGMVDVLLRRVERSLDPAERGELLRRGGSVLEELLGDPEGAIDAYRRAAEEDDTDVVALEALDRLYAQSSDHQRLAETLRRRIELELEPDVRVELGLRLGELCEKQLGEPDDAMEAFQRVLDDAPNQPDAVSALGRLYERQARWPELLDNLRQQVALASGPDEQVNLYHRMGTVLESELDDAPEAIETFQQALAVDSRHEPSIQALLRITQLEDFRAQAAEILEPLLHVQERWNDLARLIELKVQAATDPVDKRFELRRLAEVHENGRQDRAAAFDALGRALEEDPTDTQTADDLERLGEALGAWEALADVFASRASSALDPAVTRSLYTRLAHIAEERLGDDARAVEACARAAEQVGDDEELLASLDRLYVKLQSWPELADVLERRIAMSADPARRADLQVRLGEVREQHLVDPRGAFASFQEVLEDNPADERAHEAMRRLGDDPELALDVLDTLDNAYRQVGSLEKVADLYDLRVKLVDTDGERVRLLQDAAAMWENEIGDASRALESLRRAFELDPRDEILLGELERLAGITGAWESLRGVVERTVEGASDLEPMAVRDLHLRAASWYRERLGDPAAAEARLRTVLELDPEVSDAHAQLVDLLRNGGREGDLVRALEAWAAVEADEVSRGERLREAAVLAESALGDAATATRCYEAILEADPSEPEALDQLVRLRTADERWPDVAELLVRRIDVTADPTDRIELRYRLAELYAGPLASAERAVEAYQAALDDDPTDLRAIDALERLYEQAERWEDLRELLDRRLDMASTNEERIAARVRLARLSEQAFGRRREAIEQLREILQMDPGNGEATAELERLLMAEEAWPDLVALLEERARIAAETGDAGAELDVLGKLAAVHEQHTADAGRAIEMYERILARDPGHRASLEALVRLHGAAGDAEGTAATLERLLGVQQDAEAIATAHRLAEVAENELGDPARAEAALRRALEVDPSSSATRERLKAHYEGQGDFGRFAQMLAMEEQELEDPAAKVALLKRIADIYRESLADPASAAQYLERASQLVPDDRGVLLPLCDLYIAAGRQQDAIPVLEKIVESFGTRRSKELAQYHHRLGQALEGLGETEKALQHYDAAFKIDLTNVCILRDLGRLCHARGDYDRAQKTFRALLLQKLNSDAGITKADVYFYLGDISAKQGDKSKAVSMLERAVAEQKGHPSASALLAQLKG